MVNFVITFVAATLCNMGAFWLAWTLSGKANRDRIEISYPKIEVPEIPRGGVKHYSESDLAHRGDDNG